MNRSLSHSESPQANQYLFRNSYGQIEFLMIEDDMSQLNNYCRMFLNATDQEINSAEHWVRNAEGVTARNADGEELDFMDYEVRDIAQEHLDAWQDTGSFLARANCLLLLACFTEKSLVSLCRDLGSRVPRPKPGNSKVSTCIDFLREVCGVAFDEPDASIRIREQCRLLRNSFAHGEWDECRKLVGEVDLEQAFKAVSSLLSTIETSYEGRRQ